MEDIKESDAIDLECFLKPVTEKNEGNMSSTDIYFCQNNNPMADGSAYLEVGDIKVSCSVNGPLEMRQDGQLVAAIKIAHFASWLPKEQLISLEKHLSRFFLSAIEPSIMLHQFPRGKYEIVAHILDIGPHKRTGLIGDCLASAITCAGLALINAGVQMYDLLVGFNLNLSIIEQGTGHMCVAVLPKLQQFSMLYAIDSHLSQPTTLQIALNQAMDKCLELSNVIRNHLCSQLK